MEEQKIAVVKPADTASPQAKKLLKKQENQLVADYCGSSFNRPLGGGRLCFLPEKSR